MLSRPRSAAGGLRERAPVEEEPPRVPRDKQYLSTMPRHALQIIVRAHDDLERLALHQASCSRCLPATATNRPQGRDDHFSDLNDRPPHTIQALPQIDLRP